MHSSIYMIEVPATIWGPKVINKYTTPHLEDNDVDDLLDYGQYRKCLYKPKLSWSKNTTREDIILFDEVNHANELTKDLKFDDSVDASIRVTLTSIVKEYWDCFIKTGAKRTVLGYEFGIDTCGEKTVCCRKPSYGPNETKVIMQ